MDIFKKFFQKNFILLLLFSILASLGPNAFAASKNKTSLLSVKESEAVKNLVVINSSISRYKQKTNKLNREIYSLEKELKTIKSHIKENDTKLSHKKVVFNKRIESIYKEGKTSFIEIILKSKNISEIIKNLGFFKAIADNDNLLINNLSKDKNELNNLRLKLNGKIIFLKKLKEENKSSYSKLILKEKSQRKYINELKSKKERVSAISNQVAAVRNKMKALGQSKAPKGKKIRVLATGYGAHSPSDGTNGNTSTGIPAAHGVAAVSANPSNRVLPLGTKIYVPGYGKAVIADVGGGVGSNQIDLCFETHSEGDQWGVRWVTITVYD